MNEDTRRKIAREVHKARQVEVMLPDELTHRAYAEINNISYKVAERELKEAVLEGLMTRRKARSDGHIAWAYKLV